MLSTPPILRTDYYKLMHNMMYPEGTEYATYYWTARKSMVPDSNEVVFFGLQAFIDKYLYDDFKENFFYKRKSLVIDEYRDFVTKTIGKDYAGTEHIEALYDLGYLPLCIKALPEGTVVPIGVPMIEVTNTVPGFHWLPGYLETLLSCNLWQPITSATMARRFRQYLNDECRSIGESPMKAGRMCTDFSMRGMTSPESAESSGGAHMLFFDSSANIPAMCWLQNYYCVSFGNFQGTGVPSTEHSVMSSYGIYEEEAYKTLLKRFPTGPLSIVLDTYDLWNVVNNILPSLKDKILSRNGTIYIHLDSGNPVDIIVGDPESSDCNEHKGIVELLWNHFGGTVGDNGLKLLDNHIRVTYGDAITLDRCKAICQGLRAKGFSPLNVSFGIDSYTYQCVTRDTYSFEFCCTNAVIDGQSRAIYKSPKTDKDSFKASHKGLCRVYYKDGKLRVQDGLGPSDFDYMNWNELKSVFVDGNFMLMEHFKTIKERCFEGLDW